MIERKKIEKKEESFQRGTGQLGRAA